MTHSLRAALVIAAAALAVWPGGFASAQEACGQAAAGLATIAAVRDGRTLLLADGREIRLAAIEVTEASRAALVALAEGRALTLRSAPGGTDRYGRPTVFAYPPGGPQSLQQTLLEQGLARMSARVDEKNCVLALLAAERAARDAGRGLWADPNFAPLRAENLPRIAAERGQFALVEGKVLSVRESGATIYVNFGRRWTRDFTVTILKRTQRTFAGAGLDPKGLEGRRIRVRGWIEQRAGPVIAATAPEQIEVLD
ncbi:MAG: thermonuclease family protein [Pseudolabrys sp.]|nr:thermonuclease family protein [Pseudolabrys sp.]